MTDKIQKTGLELLRVSFPANQTGKLPKPTKAQTDAVKGDFKEGVRCEVCGGWHHPKVVHLDYVGHAALTDRLLDCDPKWNWAPVAIAEDGTPKFDSNGGMWIRLTVCDVTRLGYGFADGKSGGNALKEVIGDALRNAAMRFGAALDLWHKGELHAATDDDTDNPPKAATDDDNADPNPPERTGRRVGPPPSPPASDPFSDNPDYDPTAEADRLLKALKHTADCDLKSWGKTNSGAMIRLKNADRTQYDNVLTECNDRAARITREDAA